MCARARCDVAGQKRFGMKEKKKKKEVLCVDVASCQEGNVLEVEITVLTYIS